MATPRPHCTYDHRFRHLIRETKDVRIAIQNGVPRSTARDWSRSTTAHVVTLDVVERSALALEREVIALRDRNARLTAVLRLLVVLVKVLGITLRRRRVADSAGKNRLLHAVERSRAALPLRIALRLLGLSSSRYHSWIREEDCVLDDVSSCPRSCPGQLTPEELRVMKDMATSEDYRHVPTGTLSLLAQCYDSPCRVIPAAFVPSSDGEASLGELKGIRFEPEAIRLPRPRIDRGWKEEGRRGREFQFRSLQF
jgi:hypothetical protein